MERYGACIHHLFEARAAQSADRVAILDGASSLTFAEVNDRADELAAHLRSLGVGPEVCVGICLPRSAESVIAVLAVFKAGGAYLALDPGYPEPRLRFMVDDARPAVILSHSAQAMPWRGARPRLDVDRLPALATAASPAVFSSPDLPAYIVYTSGSTGVPKGVVGQHRGMVNRMHWMWSTLPFGEGAVAAHRSSLNFLDVVCEVWGALIAGVPIVVVPPALESDPRAMLALLRRHAVTHLVVVPSLLRALLDAIDAGAPRPHTWRRVHSSGESLPADLVVRFGALFPDCELLNLYGASEVSADVTSIAFTGPAFDGPVVPIGRPLDNMRVYVLDEALRLCPPGADGELYAAGVGLARGYLARPGLTAERFVPDPFGSPGARMYRTGDRARWRDDGTLECLGRLDHQVKVRGFRVELDEVAAALRSHPGVRQCVVLAAREASGDNRLVAYVVGEMPSVTELRRHVARSLPDHMIPAVYVPLDALPLTPSGKIDCLALPAPVFDRSALPIAYAAPRTGTEVALAAIWAEVLGVEAVGVHDEFLMLGGHSLRATEIVNRIAATLHVEVPLPSLFDAATVAAQARLVESTPGGPLEPIAPATGHGRIPLSFAQERLWFLDQLIPGTAEYNVALALRLDGPLDARALEAAVDWLVERHDILRTSLPSDDLGPYQRVAPHAAVSLDVEACGPEGLATRLREEAARPFDLATGPVWRASLLRVEPRTHVLLFTVHHVAIDGWSLALILDDLRMAYAALAAGERPSAPPLPVRYGDYASWQRDTLTDEELGAKLGWWRETLAGAPVLELPIDRPRPAMRSIRGATAPLTWDASLSDGIDALARRGAVTPFMLVLAALSTVLSRYSGQADLVIGAPVAHRARREVEGVVGLFANPLALRVDLTGDPTVTELLRRVRQATLGAYAHQDVPFERVVDASGVARDTSRTPLFQVMLVFEAEPLARCVAGDLTIEPQPVDAGAARFDLTVLLDRAPDGFHGAIEYCTDLFDGETIDRFARHLRAVLEAMVADPGRPISALELLTPVERAALLDHGSAPTSAPVDVVQRFEAQVRRTPEATAVVCEDAASSYAHLHARASHLAWALRSHRVGPEARVGICLERGIDQLVAILAVLLAGGAYVPLDPGHPEARLRFMADDAGLRVVLTRSTSDLRWPGEIHRIDIEPHGIGAALVGDGRPEVRVEPAHLAYVIYTSGSTGRPKGVAVTRGGLANYADWALDAYADGLSGRVVSHLATGFDASITTLLLPLLAGGTVVLAPETAGRGALLETLAGETDGIGLLKLTPSHLAMLATAGRPLPSDGVIIVGGEALSTETVRRALALGPARRIVNEYGPTEAVVGCAAFGCDPGGLPATAAFPIGRPVASTRLYVLSPALELCPMGMPGELYIAGAGVARGYVQRPALTAERFVPDPFGPPGSRMYRSGDRCRWRSDGELEFLGRLDQQVKIRGHRIELGEVEAAARDHPAVAECVVVPWTDGHGDTRLVAYCAGNASATDLRAHLAKTLPPPMMPSVFMVLDGMPLTPHGKIDRRALPTPRLHRSETDVAYAPPRTPTEAGLRAIWSEVLGVDEIGIHDEFFTLGGHSLRATQVAARIATVFGVEVPLRAMFEATTIATQARRIDETTAGVGGPIEPVDRTTRLPLSFAQERMWFLDRLNPGSAEYNVPLAMRLRGPLDVPALEASLRWLTARHEALRTTLPADEAGPYQRISPPRRVSLPVEEVDATTLAARLDDEASRPFDLGAGPLWRAHLWRRNATDHTLLFNVHHAAFDGWSTHVLMREMGAAYEALAAGRAPSLSPPAVGYADFAAWQRRGLAGEALASKLAWWRETLAHPPTLALPVDHARPAVRSSRGSLLPVALDATASHGIDALARRTSVTPYMVVLAAFAAVLSRHAGQEDIIVGSPITHRSREALEGVVGLFVNTLALRVDLSGDPSVTDLLRRVRQTTLGAYAHQDVPFEKVVEALDVARDPSLTPLFQVMLVFESAPVIEARLGGVEVELVPIHTGVIKFDLILRLERTAGGMQGGIEYCTDLFERATIERLAGHLQQVLGAMVAESDQRLSTIEMLTEAERDLLLVAWNEALRPEPHEASAHGLFEAHARRRPDAPAVIFRGMSVSYAELDARANRLAHHLASLVTGPEQVIAVCMERSPGAVVAIYAVLKAGAAFVPIEPTYPRRRIEAMLDASAATVVITDGVDRSLFPPHARIVDLSIDADRIARCPACPFERRPALPQELAYIIFTSGTTGVPKGILMTHESVVTRVDRTQRSHRFEPSDRMLQHGNLSFDLFLWELFIPLSLGAALVMTDPARLGDFAYLAGLLEDERITIARFVPAVLRLLLDSAHRRPCEALRRVITGGDKLSVPLMTQFLERFPHVELYNQFGPAERPSSISWHCQPEPGLRSVPIGRPHAETRVYLLDQHLGLVPPGAVGEAYLGGVGLARGYLGNARLTAERFVPDPCSTVPGARMYRTGDLARWRADGLLDFVGRADFQVKVRGQRIELREIEQCLLRFSGVRDAAAVAWATGDADRADDGVELVAYVEADASLELTDLRTHLAAELPAYMVPSRYVVMDALPLSSNGKIDRKALPDPRAAGVVAASPYVEPRTPLERAMAALWQDVLDRPRVGADDNFFALGGHSLLAMRLVWRLQAATEHDVRLADLFAAPTVSGLAGLLAERARARSAPVPIGPRSVLPAAPVQRALWLHEQQASTASAYNVGRAHRLIGALDSGALVHAFRRVVQRHESLRTTFFATGDGVAQRIHPEPLAELRILDLRSDADREAEVRRRARSMQRTRFALEHGPLYFAELIELADDERVLLLAIHHIVADGWSFGVLFDELTRAYRLETDPAAPSLDPLPLQYKDYADWQTRRLSSPAAALDRDYWTATLRDPPEPVELPGQLGPANSASDNGRLIEVELDPAVVAGLQAFGRSRPVGLHAIVVALMRILLYRYTGQPDAVIGVFTSGRSRPELAGLIGHFVNTLALRGVVAPHEPFIKAAERERRRLTEAFAHEEYPFDQVVRDVNAPRSPGRPPLLDILVVFDARPSAAPALPGVLTEAIAVDRENVLEHLVFDFHSTKDRLLCQIMFRGEAFDEGFVGRMWTHFAALARSVVTTPDRPARDLDLLPAAERSWLLVECIGRTLSYDGQASLVARFEAQAARTPDAPAVEPGDGQSPPITYRELDREADRVAAALVACGVCLDEPVGLVAHRTPAFIVGMLGILKAGGAYVPLAPDQPEDRLRVVLDIASIRVVLCPGDIPPIFADTSPSPRTLLLTLDAALSDAIERRPPLRRPMADNLAYVVYTSGSTGQPKGVGVTHRNVVDFVGSIDFIETGPAHGMLQVAPLTFDGATFDIWVSLLNGARLVMFEPAVPTLAELREVIARARITTMFMPTGLVHLSIAEAPEMIASFPELVTGGDTLSASHVARILPRMIGSLSNVYGPTECTCFKTVYTMRRGTRVGDRLPIGPPMPNCRIYVVDRDFQLLPTGVPGELCIAGPGLARGYVGAPAMTAERFVPDPFGAPGARMYRTGDLARYLPDGTLDFLGRLDHQVKIRGHRIEPAEIEAALSGQAGVRHAVVLARREGVDKALIGFVVGSPSLGMDELRAKLAETLPAYMVPGHIVRVDEIPCTPNGKVDRGALLALVADTARASASAAPANETEHALLGIVSDVMDRTGLGVTDDLFACGLDSLLAIRLAARIRARLGVELPISRIFEAPRVRDLARLTRAGQRESVSMMPLNEGEGPPLVFMPSIYGYALVFGPMASHLEGIPCRGLELLDEVDPFANHARMIELIGDGTCVLVGYSAGGNMAHHLAARMAPGQVSDIVLLDSHVRGEPEATLDTVEARLDESVRALSGVVRGKISGLVPDVGELLDEMTRKLRGILRYWFLHVEQRQIDADLHLILAEGGDERRARQWARFTRGAVHVHQGSGPHYDMLEEPHATINAAIVARIVETIRARRTRSPSTPLGSHAAGRTADPDNIHGVS